MSEPVHRIYYEVVGAGLPIAAEHYALKNGRAEAGFAIAHSFGAVGFRPNHGTGIRQLIFIAKASEPPEGFKLDATEPGGRIACKPDKRTAKGKTAVAALAAFEGMPTDEELAAALGYAASRAPMDGYKIYWPKACRLLFPSERLFLDIPRQAGDGWEPPEHLVEVPTSTFMLAMETHNAEARRQQAALADAA